MDSTVEKSHVEIQPSEHSTVEKPHVEIQPSEDSTVEFLEYPWRFVNFQDISRNLFFFGNEFRWGSSLRGVRIYNFSECFGTWNILTTSYVTDGMAEWLTEYI